MLRREKDERWEEGKVMSAFKISPLLLQQNKTKVMV